MIRYAPLALVGFLLSACTTSQALLGNTINPPEEFIGEVVQKTDGMFGSLEKTISLNTSKGVTCKGTSVQNLMFVTDVVLSCSDGRTGRFRMISGMYDTSPVGFGELNGKDFSIRSF